jgi:hypothetical protein
MVARLNDAIVVVVSRRMVHQMTNSESAGMTRTRAELLGKLEVGDILAAQRPSGAKLTCIVLNVDNGEVKSRRVTTQELCHFDIVTGVELVEGRPSGGGIYSVEPLSIEIHNILIGLDRRYRLTVKTDRARITELEKDALISLDAHFLNSPLPD